VSSKKPSKSSAKKKPSGSKAKSAKKPAPKSKVTVVKGSKAIAKPAYPSPPPTKKHPNRVPPPPIGKNAPRPMPKQAPPEEKGKRTPKIDMATARSVAATAITQKADNAGYVVINGRRVRMISSKAAVKNGKKKRVKIASEAERAKSAEEIDVLSIKTRLSAAELAEHRAILIARRNELIGRVEGLEDEALRSNGGNLSNMPLHMADVGTDTFDQEFALNLAASDRVKLAEIDEAIARIDDRTYGVCQLTGKPIPKARLEANPLAKYTVEAARMIERGVAH
jgi:RNA polymerase-binding transcription factor DksA